MGAPRPPAPLRVCSTERPQPRPREQPPQEGARFALTIWGRRTKAPPRTITVIQATLAEKRGKESHHAEADRHLPPAGPVPAAGSALWPHGLCLRPCGALIAKSARQNKPSCLPRAPPAAGRLALTLGVLPPPLWGFCSQWKSLRGWDPQGAEAPGTRNLRRAVQRGLHSQRCGRWRAGSVGS